MEASPQSPADTAAIRAIVRNEIDAWNRGDAVGYCKDFLASGSCTNIRGQFFTGYDAFLKQHQIIFLENVQGFSQPDNCACALRAAGSCTND